MTEIYKIPEGRITISVCNENLSIGLLDLNSNQELPKHNRPVNEQLTQIYGSCVMKLFESDKIIKQVVLNEGDKLMIPANQFYIHANSSDERSITVWKFEGNIVEVIENIRNSFQKP